MKLNKIKKIIKCDTVMCNKTATYEFETNSFKGNSYLCDCCFQEFQKLFKRTTLKNEQKG